MNKYLIAYIAPNDRVFCEIEYENTQQEAIKTFKRYNPCREIIAITLLEEETHQREDKGDDNA